LFATQQKKANKIINGSSASHQITALKDEGGTINTDPEKVKELAHTFFQQQANPVNGRKDGKYLPNDVARQYPWDAHNLDKFQLESKTTDPRYKAISILDLMSEKTRFLTKVRYLSKGKAPGKDDVPNEVLKISQTTSLMLSTPCSSSCT
jgi:hypothetical protein